MLSLSKAIVMRLLKYAIQRKIEDFHLALAMLKHSLRRPPRIRLSYTHSTPTYVKTFSVLIMAIISVIGFSFALPYFYGSHVVTDEEVLAAQTATFQQLSDNKEIIYESDSKAVSSQSIETKEDEDEESKPKRKSRSRSGPSYAEVNTESVDAVEVVEEVQDKRLFGLFSRIEKLRENFIQKEQKIEKLEEKAIQVEEKLVKAEKNGNERQVNSLSKKLENIANSIFRTSQSQESIVEKIEKTEEKIEKRVEKLEERSKAQDIDDDVEEKNIEETRDEKDVEKRETESEETDEGKDNENDEDNKEEVESPIIVDKPKPSFGGGGSIKPAAKEEKPKAPEPEVFGSIAVCKIVIDDQGNIIDHHGVIEIAGLEEPESFNGKENTAKAKLDDTRFELPLKLNENLLGDQNDAQCAIYKDLPMGGYFYAQEESSVEWDSVLYNDQFKFGFNIDDFYEYSPEHFTDNESDDKSRNLKSDGHIVLTKSEPNRILAILNQVKVPKEPPTVYIESELEVVEVNKKFTLVIGGKSDVGLSAVWFWGDQTEVDANVDLIYPDSPTSDSFFSTNFVNPINLDRAFGSPLFSEGVNEYEFKAEIVIDEPGTYKFGANSRDILYPVEGEAHQASEGKGIAYFTVQVIDTQNPTVKIINPLDLDTVAGNIEIAANVEDNVKVEKVEFFIDETFIGESQGPYSIFYDTSKIPDGTYEIKAKAYDTSGNMGVHSIAIITDNFDLEPPEVEFANIVEGQILEDSESVEIVATDNVGVVLVEFFIEDQRIGTSLSSPFRTWLHTSLYEDGEYQISAKAYDKSGNVGSESIMIEIDNVEEALIRKGSFVEYDSIMVGGGYGQAEDIRCTEHNNITDIKDKVATVTRTVNCFYMSGDSIDDLFRSWSHTYDANIEDTSLPFQFLWIKEDPTPGEDLINGHIVQGHKEFLDINGKNVENWITVSNNQTCTNCIYGQNNKVDFTDVKFWFDVDSRVHTRSLHRGFEASGGEAYFEEYMLTRSNVVDIPDYSGERVKICHVYPGNSQGKKNTITVVPSIVDIHLSHGSYLGECNADPAPEPEFTYIIDTESDGGSGAVIKIDLNAGNQELFSSGQLFVDPVRAVFDQDGNMFVVDVNALENGGIIKLDKYGKQEAYYTSINFVSPLGIEIDSKNNIYIADADAFDGNGAIFKITPDKEESIIAQGEHITHAVDIAIVDDGSILIMDVKSNGGALIKLTYNEESNVFEQELISSGGEFFDPSGVEVGPDGYYIADPNAFGGPGNGGIIKLINGEQIAVSNSDLFTGPNDLDFDSDNNIITTSTIAYNEPGYVLRVTDKKTEVVSERGYIVSPHGVLIKTEFFDVPEIKDITPEPVPEEPADYECSQTICLISPQHGDELTGVVEFKALVKNGYSVQFVYFSLDSTTVGGARFPSNSLAYGNIFTSNVDTSHISNGEHKIHAIAFQNIDSVGMTETITITTKNKDVDNVPPVIDIDLKETKVTPLYDYGPHSFQDDVKGSHGVIYATAKDPDGGFISLTELYIDGNLVPSSLRVHKINEGFDASEYSIGIHEIEVRAYDLAGNIGIEKAEIEIVPITEETFTRKMPTVYLTSPGIKSNVSGIVEMNGKAKSSYLDSHVPYLGDVKDSNIEKVEFFINDEKIDELTKFYYNDREKEVSIKWDSTTVDDGVYIIKVIIHDSLGYNNSHTDYHTRQIVVDNVPGPQPVIEPDTEKPTAYVISPKEGEVVSGTFVIEAGATDNLKMNSVKFFIDGAKVGGDGTRPYTHTVDSTQYEDGPHVIHTKSFDQAGNTKRSQKVNIIIDNIPDPEPIEFSTYGIVEGGEYFGTFTLEAYPNEVDRVDFILEGYNDLSYTASIAPYIFQLDTTLVEDGQHTITVKAVRGNEFIEKTIAFTTNNHPPEECNLVCITSHNDGDVVSESVPVEFEWEVNSDYDIVALFVDGQHKASAGTTGTYATQSPWTYTWNTIALDVADGEHTFEVRAIKSDGSGYRNRPELGIDSHFVTVTVDNSAYQNPNQWDIRNVGSGATYGIEQVFAHDENTVYTVSMEGSAYALFKSTDGGKNSLPILSLNGFLINDFHVIDPNNIIVVYGNGDDEIMHFTKSTDGGQTWGNSQIVNDGKYVSRKIFSNNGQDIFVAYDYPTAAKEIHLATSNDGGQSWSTNKIASQSIPWTHTPAYDYVGSLVLGDIHVTESGTIYILYKEHANDITSKLQLAKSVDNGQNWEIITIHDFLGASMKAPSMDVIGEDKIFIGHSDWTGPNNRNQIAVDISTDGGLTWTNKVIGTLEKNSETHQIDAIDDNNVFLVYRVGDGYDIALAKSTDGGNSWETETIEENIYWNGGGIAVAGKTAFTVFTGQSKMGKIATKMLDIPYTTNNMELLPEVEPIPEASPNARIQITSHNDGDSVSGKIDITAQVTGSQDARIEIVYTNGNRQAKYLGVIDGMVSTSFDTLLYDTNEYTEARITAWVGGANPDGTETHHSVNVIVNNPIDFFNPTDYVAMEGDTTPPDITVSMWEDPTYDYINVLEGSASDNDLVAVWAISINNTQNGGCAYPDLYWSLAGCWLKSTWNMNNYPDGDYVVTGFAMDVSRNTMYHTQIVRIVNGNIAEILLNEKSQECQIEGHCGIFGAEWWGLKPLNWKPVPPFGEEIAEVIYPDIEITNLADGQIISGEVGVSATVGPQMTGFSTVDIKIIGEGKILTTSRLIATGGLEPTGQVSYLLDTTQFNDGEAEIEFSVGSNLDKYYSTVAVLIDNDKDITPPEIGNIGFSREVTPGEFEFLASSAKLYADIKIRAIVTDNSGVNDVRFFIDGTQVGSDNSVLYEYMWDTSQYVDGEHEVTVEAVDHDGNIQRKSTTKIIDNTNDVIKPEITITTPTEDSTVSEIVTITVDASDNIGIEKVRFGGYGSIGLLGTDYDAPYSIEWDTGNLISLNETMTIYALAYDAAGNLASDTIHIYVDNSEPIPEPTQPIQITSHNDGDTVSGVISVSASVPGYDFVYMQMEQPDGARSMGSTLVVDGVATKDFYTTHFDNGEVIVSVWDKTDSSIIDSIRLTIDNEIVEPNYTRGDPHASLAGAVWGTEVSGIVTLTGYGGASYLYAMGEVNIRDATLTKFEFFVDGNLIGETTSFSPDGYGAMMGSISWDSSTVSNGEHNFTVIAHDDLGFSSDGAMATPLKVDNPEPSE